MTESVLVQMDAQGRLVLPQQMRGAKKQYFTCQCEEDGTVHLIPVVGVITAKQAYFWTKRWQRGEQEASQDLKKGRYKTVNPEQLEAYLDKL